MILTIVGNGVQVARFKARDWFIPRNAAVLVHFGISQVANLTRGVGDADMQVHAELLDETIAGVIARGVLVEQATVPLDVQEALRSFRLFGSAGVSPSAP